MQKKFLRGRGFIALMDGDRWYVVRETLIQAVIPTQDGSTLIKMEGGVALHVKGWTAVEVGAALLGEEKGPLTD